MQVALADGNPRIREVLVTKVDVDLEGRTIPTQFIILPNSKDNRTLLGVDFMEDAGIIINTPQRSWHFIEDPKQEYDYQGETNETEGDSIPGITCFVADTKRAANIPGGSLARISTATSSLRSPRKRTREGAKSKWSEVDKLFQKCLRTYESGRMDIAAVGIEEIREDEAVSITPKEIEKLQNLLKVNKELFQAEGPPTAEAIHRINTENHAPIAVPPYRLPPAKRELLQKELKKMLECDIIGECESPWVAPVVLVPKKNGSILICVDYRRLNAITVSDSYPLPRIDDLLHAAKKTNYMSTLDLQSGY
uniref:uncharacterized protein LOC117610644 n=1 Tax=Osmia lignaria TaxID=473952 RepID=UPI0014780E6F|nr:uncharacterized protein LOC117610644 [Osmia lignaria]